VRLSKSNDSFGYDTTGNLQYQYNGKYTYYARGRLIYANSLGTSLDINGLGQRVHKKVIANTPFAYDAEGI
jgi:hypothetical protein